MITKARFKQIMTIGLPIMIAMSTGNILTLADTIMVGRLGKEAMAAAGVSGFAITLIFATFMGLASAVQAITARRAGEGRIKEATHSIHAGLALAVGGGIVLSAISIPLVPIFFPYLSKDPNVIELGVPYMQVNLMALLATFINVVFTGYWNGLGKTKTYTLITMASHMINILLNYIFIFGKFGVPAYGVVGAAIATTISIYLTTIAFFILIIKEKPEGLFKMPIQFDVLKRIVSLMIPMAVRAMFQHSGYLLFTVIMGMVGTIELAATTILVRVMMISILPVFGIGTGGGTLAGQSLGAGQPDAAEAWGWDTAKIGAVFLALIGIPFFLFPEFFLNLLINDAETVAIAILPLQFIGLNRPLYVMFIFASLLITTGDVKRPTYFQLGVQYLFFLPAVFVATFYFNTPFIVVWLFEGVNIAIQLCILAYLWRRGEWKKIEL